MEAKFPHVLFEAFLIFLVLQAFVVNSRPVKLESPQISNDTEGRPYIIGRTCGFPYIIGQQISNDTEGRPVINHGMSYELVDNYTYFSGQPKWTKFPVTWGFRSGSSLPSGLDSQAVNDAMDAAFAEWQAAVPKFAFQRVNQGDTANIKIAFTPLQGGYYGFGWAPPNGRLDLDNNNTNWSTGARPGSNQLDLQSGAMHEIGHTLGLDHSPYDDAVMFWSLDSGTNKRDLSQDDIDGIQNLYA